MKTISASEANRNFSMILRTVAKGEVYTIVSRGKPVASIRPIGPETAQRRRAKSALLERLHKQPVTGARKWSREDLYA